MIFYKNEKLFPQYLNYSKQKYNQELIEVQDEKLVKQIRDELNLNFDEHEDCNPIICGSIVNGGFVRKLKMMRADLFSILSVCHSHYFIQNNK